MRIFLYLWWLHDRLYRIASKQKSSPLRNEMDMSWEVSQSKM